MVVLGAVPALYLSRFLAEPTKCRDKIRAQHLSVGVGRHKRVGRGTRARTRAVMVPLVCTSFADVEGFVGQTLSQSKFRKKSQDFDNGVPKGRGC